jgi:hypothetical protein
MRVQASPVHTEALSRAQAANVMSFVYPGGQEVTVLVSKSGGRYRLQANSFPAMWLVLQQLVARLTDHFAAASKNAAARTPQEQQGDGGTAAAFAVTCDDALPLQVCGVGVCLGSCARRWSCSEPRSCVFLCMHAESIGRAA